MHLTNLLKQVSLPGRPNSSHHTSPAAIIYFEFQSKVTMQCGLTVGNARRNRSRYSQPASIFRERSRPLLPRPLRFTRLQIYRRSYIEMTSGSVLVHGYRRLSCEFLGMNVTTSNRRGATLDRVVDSTRRCVQGSG